MFRHVKIGNRRGGQQGSVRSRGHHGSDDLAQAGQFGLSRPSDFYRSIETQFDGRFHVERVGRLKKHSRQTDVDRLGLGPADVAQGTLTNRNRYVLAGRPCAGVKREYLTTFHGHLSE